MHKPEFVGSGQKDKNTRDGAKERFYEGKDIPEKDTGTGLRVVEKVDRSRTYTACHEESQGAGKPFKPKGRK